MSGPKVDHAELERQRQAELERKRQERLRKIREETEKLNRERSKVEQQIESIKKHLKAEINTISDVKEMQSTIQRLEKLKKATQSHLESLLSINTPTEPHQIAEYTKNLKNQSDNIIKDYYSQSQQLQEQILSYISGVESLKQLEKIQFSGEVKKVEHIVDFDFSIEIRNIEKSDKVQVDVKERAKSILTEIENLINSDNIIASDLKILTIIANNIYSSAFQTGSGFASSEAEYKTIIPSVIKNQEIFDMLYQDYYAEYLVYIELLNKNRATPLAIIPKEKYQFVSIEQLQKEKEIISQQCILQNEKNYIRTQIDEVMKECGYNITKEIIFDENEKANHFVCYDATQSSAIHIRVSDDKQIMMEVVAVEVDNEVEGVDLNIGTQITGEQVDPTESSFLVSQMGKFCDLHPKIIDELRKRGVVFNIKTRKEPNAKYCKKIFITDRAGKARRSLINTNTSYQHRTKAKELQTMALSQ